MDRDKSAGRQVGVMDASYSKKAGRPAFLF